MDGNIVCLKGYGVPDRKRLPCPSTWGSAAVLSYLFHGDRKLFQSANTLKNLHVHSPRWAPLACNATPNNNRRNPDFSRQHKGSSRGKSRPFRDRENNPESLEETDLLPSKNGPVLSLSGNQRYQATATPGRREKEIIELFRKVQAQLRARAAIKEEKKVEASQQGQGEKGTVDSLLKLLRKHSQDQGEKSRREEDFNIDQPEKSKPFEEEQNSAFFGSNNLAPSEEVHQPDPVAFSRPASNFRRKSPVPRVKFQPVFSAEEDGCSISSLKSEGEKSSVDDQDLDLESLGEADEVLFLHDNPEFLEVPSESCYTDETYEGTTVPSATESADLSSLKLSELRGLAKSRGIKGYSRLKKSELVELLSGDDGA